MNREIKFRGYAVEEMINSQWIEDAFGVEDIEYTNGKISTYLLTPYGDYEVIKKSVGQYTGLKDKNGKEIYEGDIVKLTIRHYIDCSRTELTNEETITQMVVFEHYTFGFTDGKGIKPFIWILGFDYDIEVIGNIYKNPELLEVRQ